MDEYRSTSAMKKRQFNTKLIWSLVTVVLAVLTVKLVLGFSGGISAAEFFDTLQNAHKGYLIGALLGMCGFVFFESEAVLCISRSIGYHRTHRHGLVYAAADVYFSAITPSATGGQPAAAFFMVRDGMPTANVTAVLVFNLIMYTIAAATNGLICIAMRPAFFSLFKPFSKFLIVIGLLVLIAMTVMFFLIMKRRDLLLRLMRFLVRLLTRLHLIRHPESRLFKLEHMANEYGKAIDMMTGHRRTVLLAYLFNLLQRMSQIMVTVCMYLALGGKMKHVLDIYVTQSMVVLGSNSVPIPGSMGVTDFLMLDGFMNLMDKASAIRLELFSRSISFYLCVLLSGLFVLTYYVISRILRAGKSQNQAADTE